MSPLEYYQYQVQQNYIQNDQNQLQVLQYLQTIYQNLMQEYQQRDHFLSFLRTPKLIKGLYLWGGVGVGKTFLMDCFYQALPFKNKLRMHFFQFMQEVHSSLAKHQGKPDPLKIIASEIAAKSMILCFDELFVSDITDAMLLGRLFNALFQNKVCLIATSNTLPDELYKNGLQREQFLPAIELIKKNTLVCHLPSAIDYRLRHLQEAGVFYTPLGEDSENKMEKSFTALTLGKRIKTNPIPISGRLINIKKQAGDVIWFDFDNLCSVPRSQQDYLEIAKIYKTIFISNIPIIQENEKDRICLFISMIDVFYDKRVRLVISAEEAVSQLYSRGYMILEYTRTHSRLLEMQSVDYFSAEFNHRS